MPFKVAIVGDSHAKRLYQEWKLAFPMKDTCVQLKFFGKGGARLDGRAFAETHVENIVTYNPHKVFLWIGGNDLCQDLNRFAYNR